MVVLTGNCHKELQSLCMREPSKDTPNVQVS